jgi:hypothetical protein
VTVPRKWAVMYLCVMIDSVSTILIFDVGVSSDNLAVFVFHFTHIYTTSGKPVKDQSYIYNVWETIQGSILYIQRPRNQSRINLIYTTSEKPVKDQSYIYNVWETSQGSILLGIGSLRYSDTIYIYNVWETSQGSILLGIGSLQYSDTIYIYNVWETSQGSILLGIGSLRYSDTIQVK